MHRYIRSWLLNCFRDNEQFDEMLGFLRSFTRNDPILPSSYSPLVLLQRMERRCATVDHDDEDWLEWAVENNYEHPLAIENSFTLRLDHANTIHREIQREATHSRSNPQIWVNGEAKTGQIYCLEFKVVAILPELETPRHAVGLGWLDPFLAEFKRNRERSHFPDSYNIDFGQP